VKTRFWNFDKGDGRGGSTTMVPLLGGFDAETSSLHFAAKLGVFHVICRRSAVHNV
jgi:hypothetical protein